MRILTALNAFKGAPREQNVVAVNQALATSLRAQGHEVKSFPIADGGDGTADLTVVVSLVQH